MSDATSFAWLHDAVTWLLTPALAARLGQRDAERLGVGGIELRRQPLPHRVRGRRVAAAR